MTVSLSSMIFIGELYPCAAIQAVF
jgi:hypothetical protein